MSRDSMTKAVIRFLEKRDFKFKKFLGRGGFADIIGVHDPAGRDVAVKIVRREDIWAIEDQYWPRLRHPHIIEVYDVIKIKKLNCKLYLMPVLPRALYEVVESKEFRKDPNSFKRVNKWIFQILSAIEYLHTKGLAHLDTKTDNVLIDGEDNAILADFTGLNFTKDPIKRLTAPDVFRSPECFVQDANKNIRGECFDIWTYGLLVLNVMTGHYFAKKASFTNRSTHLWPILQKVLKKSKFKKLLRKSFPKACISPYDLNVALHFIKFMLNIKPEDRPSAVRAKHHLLMKMTSNPFRKESLQRMSPKGNPFRVFQSELDPYSHGDVSPSKMKAVHCSTETEPTQDERTPRRGGKVMNWFWKQLNRVI